MKILNVLPLCIRLFVYYLCFKRIFNDSEDDDDDDDDNNNNNKREQHTRKLRSQGTTENSHIGHCTHISESTNVKVQ